MSAASRRRAIERAKAHEAEVEAAKDDAQTARCYALWREPGHGYRWAVLDLPRSIAEKYLVEIAEPDILDIALGNLETKMLIDAMGLPDLKR